MRLLITLSAIITFFYAESFAKPAALQLQSSNVRQDSMILRGIELHDAGKYDEAITIYRQVLAENRSNTYALLEIANSHYAKKAYDEALQYAWEGIKHKTDFAFQFLMVIGNVFDDQGKTEAAVEAFKLGLRLAPDFFMLHFNLGVAYFRNSELDSAGACFRRAIVLNPCHPGSHLMLGLTYIALRKDAQGILALDRFLALEPNTARSSMARAQLKEILNKSIAVDSSDPKN
jgi:tetratricopeptide (TPR) repeat protein